MSEEIDKVLFPKFLADIAILQAKQDAMEGMILDLIKEVLPENHESFLTAYESMYKKSALKKIHEIPSVDLALQEKLRLELGL